MMRIFCDKDKFLNLRKKEFGQICGVHCFQFIYNYVIKNIFCILKTLLSHFQNPQFFENCI